ncbi:MAG TPA: hypothetical protein VLG38_07210 [Gammaproteobacteria bacterium]|nr:hypothetical protein [Gammaproteobacteria bacterium]
MSYFELLSSLELGLIYGITALGICLTFRIIDFPDLTCDGSFVLGAAVAAVLLKLGYNPIFALCIAALAGGIAGLGTGVLHVYFKMTNLLAGILMAFMLYSINLKVMQGIPNIALLNTETMFTWGNPFFSLCAVAAIVWAAISFILSTDFGLALRSIGQNKRLAVNCGVQISFMTILALILSNALIAFSGALFCQHQGFADVSQGVGTIIIGLAAVMIGEKLLPSRSIWYSMFACILGSIVYRILVAAALHSEWLGLQTQDLNLITGGMVVAVMLMPTLGVRKQNA